MRRPRFPFIISPYEKDPESVLREIGAELGRLDRRVAGILDKLEALAAEHAADGGAPPGLSPAAGHAADGPAPASGEAASAPAAPPPPRSSAPVTEQMQTASPPLPAPGTERPRAGEEPLFAELLPVLDGLEAVRGAIASAGEDSWRRGIDLFHEKLHRLLESRGLRRSATVGTRFDPSLHEALGAESSPEVPAGCISQVVQDGWILGDRVLRYARVIVARDGGAQPKPE